MRKFGRKKDNRKMLLRNLLTSVIIYEKIKTTEAKAKEIKPIIDKIINIGKKNTLASRRQLLGYFTHKNAVKKIFEDLIIRYASRNSGYAYSYHLADRLGDGSKMMLLQLIPTDEKKVNIKDNASENNESIDNNKINDDKLINEKEKE